MHLISQARVWTARGIPTYHAGVFGQAWYYLFHILMSRCFLKRHQRIHWVLLLLWQSGLTGHHACYSEEYIRFWNSSISFLCSPSCLPSSPLVQAIVLLCINTCLLLPLVPVQSFQLNLSLIICISLYECCNDSNYLKSPQYGVSTCHLPHHQHHSVAHPLMQCHCFKLITFVRIRPGRLQSRSHERGTLLAYEQESCAVLQKKFHFFLPSLVLPSLAIIFRYSPFSFLICPNTGPQCIHTQPLSLHLQFWQTLEHFTCILWAEPEYCLLPKLQSTSVSLCHSTAIIFSIKDTQSQDSSCAGKQQAAAQQPISLLMPHAARDWFRYRTVPYSISMPNSVVPCLPSTARHAFVYSRCSPYPIRTGTVIWV